MLFILGGCAENHDNEVVEEEAAVKELEEKIASLEELLAEKEEIIEVLAKTGWSYELLRSLGVPGKILCIPGHNPDSISLLLDDGSCFCGDAAFNLMPWLGTRYLLPLISDMESSYRS